MHLSTEEPAASWMLELFGVVGRDVLNTFHWDKFFEKLCSKKLSRENMSKNITAGVQKWHEFVDKRKIIMIANLY